MLVLKNGQMIDLERMLRFIQVSEVPNCKASYDLRRLQRLVIKKLQGIEADRQDLLSSYCKKSEDGKTFLIPEDEEKKTELNKVWNEFALKETELDVNQFSIENFKNVDMKKFIVVKPEALNMTKEKYDAFTDAEKDALHEDLVRSFFDVFDEFGLMAGGKPDEIRGNNIVDITHGKDEKNA